MGTLMITAPGHTGTLGWNGEKMTTNRKEWKAFSTEQEAKEERTKIWAHPWYGAMKLRIS